MALHCPLNEGIESQETYYECRSDQFCCDIDQCCYFKSGNHLPQLWYCWIFVLTGILICALISAKYCKKRPNIRQVTVSSRIPHRRQQTTIMHPPSVMANVWAVYPPSYNAGGIMVTDSSGRPFSQRNDFVPSNSSTISSDGHLNAPDIGQPRHPYPDGAPPGANMPFQPAQLPSQFPPVHHGFSTVIITDSVYDEPPSYESVIKSQDHPHAVSVN